MEIVVYIINVIMVLGDLLFKELEGNIWWYCVVCRLMLVFIKEIFKVKWI